MAYVIVIVSLLFFEERLVFHPSRFPNGHWAPDMAFEDVDFVAADGTKLHGWYFGLDRPRGHLLYCHGNAGNVTGRALAANELRRKHNLAVFVFDYRGYGKSEGKPNEAGVIRDGFAAFQWLSKRANKPTAEILVLGRSLGGAVAVDLASRLGAKGLVLQNTFTSIPDVAASHYWFVPVRRLMRTRFNSIDKIARYSGPLLACHGTSDEVVPFRLGRQLFDAANEPKSFVTIEGGDHNSNFPPTYFDELARFVNELL